ncbi:MAG: (Fe-S)-binding protein [Desulfobulbaceae bacterium]|nr:(Fe-S)-binding protein [Desulfobulbaceae bacterium]
MSKNKTLKDYEQQIRECVKCGACQAHCPTYLETRKEGSVARGKIALAAALLDKTGDLEKRLRQDVSMCLMCGSCVDKCPNKVPTDKIVGAMRREITDDRGLSLIGRGVSAFIGNKSLLKGAVKTGAALSSLVFKEVPETSGLRLRFPVPQMKDRSLPVIPAKNIFDLFPEFIQGDGDKPTVGFFAGCSISFIYPEIGASMIRLLQKLGYSVFLPKSQQCCGIPALSSGDGRLVEKLAEQNIASFKKYDIQHIITCCASCNGGVKEYYSTMKADYADFTGKVVDFNVFLGEQGFTREMAELPKWPNRTKVTYHDPCHLKTQGILEEPRALLRALPNVDFVEMEGASSCCGLGGTFSVYHYETSKAIGARKIPGLTESGAEMIATACPGCIMQLQDVINHAGMKVRAVHILDLISEALDLAEAGER